MFTSALMFALSLHATVGVNQYYLQLEKYQQCPEKKNVIGRYTNIVVSHDGYSGGYKVTLYGDYILEQDIVEPVSVKAVMSKCRDDKDLCEYAFSYKTGRYCQEISNPQSFMSAFYNKTTLPKSCPIPKGNYTLNGAELPFAVFPSLAGLGFKERLGYWKVKSTGTSKHGIFNCVNMELAVRKRQSRNSKHPRKSLT